MENNKNINFNWKDHEQELHDEIAEVVKSHNNFINSELGQFLSQGEKDYGKNWVSVLWWNGKNIETYDSGVLKDAQSLIDFYHFSKARTKVIFRYNGKDITNKVKINPLYRDIFKDEILESLGIK